MTTHLKLLEEAIEPDLFSLEKGTAKIIDKTHVEITKESGEK